MSEQIADADLVELHAALRQLHRDAERVWVRRGTGKNPDEDYRRLRDALERAGRAIWGSTAMHPAILESLRREAGRVSEPTQAGLLTDFNLRAEDIGRTLAGRDE